MTIVVVTSPQSLVTTTENTAILSLVELLNIVAIESGVTTVFSKETSTIVVEESTTEIIIAQGAQGPEGPPGISEEDMPYAKRTDFVGDTIIYKGEAAVGSNTASSVWRIRRLTLGVDGDVTEEWAGGSSSFLRIWDDRLSLDYT